jgi:hypothetical protein
MRIAFVLIAPRYLQGLSVHVLLAAALCAKERGVFV